MSAETARIVHFSILAVGTAVWLAALWFHRRTFRPPDPLESGAWKAGEIDLDVPRAEVRDRIVAAFRASSATPFGSALLEEATDRRIRGRAGAYPVTGPRKNPRFEIDLTDRGSGTRAEWRVLRGGGSGLRIASGIFVYLLSPGALVAAAVVIETFVLKSSSPDVRGQSFQTLQVVHFLWPPFLFAGLARRFRTLTAAVLQNTIRNAGF